MHLARAGGDPNYKIKTGVYAMINKELKLIYIGSGNLQGEMNRYMRKSVNSKLQLGFRVLGRVPLVKGIPNNMYVKGAEQATINWVANWLRKNAGWKMLNQNRVIGKKGKPLTKAQKEWIKKGEQLLRKRLEQPKKDKTDRDWSHKLQKAVEAKNDDVFGMMKTFYDPPTDGGFGCQA